MDERITKCLKSFLTGKKKIDNGEFYFWIWYLSLVFYTKNGQQLRFFEPKLDLNNVLLF